MIGGLVAVIVLVAVVSGFVVVARGIVRDSFYQIKF